MTDDSPEKPTPKQTPKPGPFVRRRQRRLLLVALVLPSLLMAGFLAFVALRNTAVYFYPPAELPTYAELDGREIRLGGMVVDGSLRAGEDKTVYFEITDYAETVVVEFNDLLPPLFRDGQGVIVQGTLREDGVFTAAKVMAKHDENYMPPEIADTLKAKPPEAETSY